MGPVQLFAFRFETLDGFNGEILDELEALAPTTVRILDALLVAKEENGDLVAVELDDSGDALGLAIAELLGFTFEGEDPGPPPAEITEMSAAGVTVADVRRIARDLAPGTAAAMLLVEHRWAEGLRDAIRAAGGQPVLQGFLTMEGLALAGAELAATAEAMDAIIRAEALEAEAALRAIEALATIELADEVEAAVVASTVRDLVEAGFIDEADAAEAAGAVLGHDLIDLTPTDGSD